MTDHPCSKEVEIHDLRGTAKDNVSRLTEIEKRQIGIAADVSHIKGRIDNGLSMTVSDMHQNLTKLIPVIDGHTRFIDRVQDVFVSALKWFFVGLGATIAGLMVWAISKGWHP